MKSKDDTASDTRRIDELQDEIKQRDRRIDELKAELDKERDLAHELADQVRDSNDLVDRWIQAFDMMPDEAGVWKWRASFAEGAEWCEKYFSLVREWNKFVPSYNAVVRPRNVGRPLAASAAQVVQVRKLHRAGGSIRGIAEDTNLGVATVRTIITQTDGTDRTTMRHLRRVDPDRAAMRVWQAKRRTRDALPKQIHEVRKRGEELLKEARRGG